MSQQYDAPPGAPPSYRQQEGGSKLSSPQPAHLNPNPDVDFSSRPDNYNQSPYQQHANLYPPQREGYGGGPSGPGYYQQPSMGYSQQGPPPGGYYGPQGGPGYGPQGGYGPPGGYGGGPGYGPGYGGGYGGPQGQYMDQRRGGEVGFMEACLGAAACCCCLDACLLF